MTQTIQICKICGEPFIPLRHKQNVCDKEHTSICQFCGKKFVITNIHYIHKTCSVECSRRLRKQNAEFTSMQKYGVKNAGGTDESKIKTNMTCKRKYGVDWPGQSETCKQHIKETFEANGGNPMQREECKEKARQTCMQKYGAPNVLSKESNLREFIWKQAELKYGTKDPGNLPQFRDKAKQTCIQHWGVEYYLQSDIAKATTKATALAKYGVEHPMKSEEIKAKQRQSILDKYGVTNPMYLEQSKINMQQTNLQKYGVPYFCMHSKCKQSQGVQPSKIAIDIANIIQQQCNVMVEYEYSIENKSYDLHILNTNILIEIDPTYTHSVHDVGKFGSIDSQYHLQKSMLAEKYGFRCIHIFSWDNIIKICSLFNTNSIIDMGQCSIRSIDICGATNFLMKYSISSDTIDMDNTSKCYGVYHKGYLLQIMVFNICGLSWRLSHICNLPCIYVSGGYKAMFNKFIEHIHPDNILAYIDYAKFCNYLDSYLELGFTKIGTISPKKHWSYNSHHISDDHLIQEYPNLVFYQPYNSIEELEKIMVDHHWLPIYDCGELVMEWSK